MIPKPSDFIDYLYVAVNSRRRMNRRRIPLPWMLRLASGVARIRSGFKATRDFLQCFLRKMLKPAPRRVSKPARPRISKTANRRLTTKEKLLTAPRRYGCGCCCTGSPFPRVTLIPSPGSGLEPIALIGARLAAPRSPAGKERKRGG